VNEKSGILQCLNAPFFCFVRKFCVFNETFPFHYFSRALRGFAFSLEMGDLIREIADLTR